MKAVSSWSLHRTLGSYHSGDAPGSGAPVAPGGGLPLLELPAQLRAHGYDTAQICHFHLPTRDASYLAELGSAFADAGVTLDAVLVDDGDLTDPTDADTHQAWISGWLDDAAALGANRARVIAGKQTPTPERLAESGRRLGELADAHPDVRVVTENWFALTPGAAEVTAVLDAADGKIGFLIDLGNWTGPGKYAELGRRGRQSRNVPRKMPFHRRHAGQRRLCQIAADAARCQLRRPARADLRRQERGRMGLPGAGVRYHPARIRISRSASNATPIAVIAAPEKRLTRRAAAGRGRKRKRAPRPTHE